LEADLGTLIVALFARGDTFSSLLTSLLSVAEISKGYNFIQNTKEKSNEKKKKKDKTMTITITITMMTKVTYKKLV
jgi:hypothetical protein